MRWTDEVRIETPEQVEVDLELAGLGSRFWAEVIDVLIRLVVSVVLLFLVGIVLALVGRSRDLDDPALLLQLAAVAVLYLLWLGYGILFEVKWNGQTPGKRWAGIRTVKDGGGPVDGQAAAVRNILAVADFLPAFLVLGAVLILLTPRRQRLGDLAAGTVVVRERVVALDPDLGPWLEYYASDQFRFTGGQLAAVQPADRTVLREFLQRYDGLERRSRWRLAERMAAGYVKKTGYPLTAGELQMDDAVAFLASLLRDIEEARRHG